VEDVLPDVLLDFDASPHILVGHRIVHSGDYAREILGNVIEKEGGCDSWQAGRVAGDRGLLDTVAHQESAQTRG
jgi:hypothetical protein